MNLKRNYSRNIIVFWDVEEGLRHNPTSPFRLNLGISEDEEVKLIFYNENLNLMKGGVVRK